MTTKADRMTLTADDGARPVRPTGEWAASADELGGLIASSSERCLKEDEEA
jgi:hypothetical protein